VLMKGAVDRSRLKSRGDNGEPCGTPCVGLKMVFECVFSYLTVIFLSVRNDFISLQKCMEVCCNNT